MAPSFKDKNTQEYEELPLSLEELRRRAEISLQTTFGDVDEMARDDVKRLLYELQVHQIELEMQNEELRRTQWELESSRDRYRELYDFAPTGYLSLDGNGVVLQANLTAAKLLGYNRHQLVGRNLSSFLSTSSQRAFALHCQAVLETGVKKSCEFQLLVAEGPPRTVRLESTANLASDMQERSWRCSLFDITEQKQAEEKQRLLIGELNHRVKNALALVHSFFRQIIRRSEDLDSFRAAFEDRLMALARLYTLLTRNQWEDIALQNLLTASTELYRSASGDNVVLEGPPVELPPGLALPLHLIFHELTSNAAKYGAFSTPTGRVAVRWERRKRGRDKFLYLQWRELQGPPVTPPDASGFGSVLLEQTVVSQLCGTLSLDYPASGFICCIEIPLSPE